MEDYEERRRIQNII
ncbi:hypothetical protein PENVUL_c008G02756 [Penicillium vulpinum]|uniref:Uncharacterized protein n=1 Tax=Penicillium vulpinum TaxID=29845 RepID=A0A1V6S4D5_9EURO|nr:hypothetical protein PENVUL_c008G02756 [Penicillium vulpinum]